jgi:arsenate reductase-like glutaredoxin family protein
VVIFGQVAYTGLNVKWGSDIKCYQFRIHGFVLAMENGLHIVRTAKVFVYLQTKLALLICLIEGHADFAKRITVSRLMRFIKTLKTNGVAHAVRVDASKRIQDTTMLGKALLLDGDAKNALQKKRVFLQIPLLVVNNGCTISFASRQIQGVFNGILRLKNLHYRLTAFVH